MCVPCFITKEGVRNLVLAKPSFPGNCWEKCVEVRCSGGDWQEEGGLNAQENSRVHSWSSGQNKSLMPSYAIKQCTYSRHTAAESIAFKVSF